MLLGECNKLIIGENTAAVYVVRMECILFLEALIRSSCLITFPQASEFIDQTTFPFRLCSDLYRLFLRFECIQARSLRLF